MKRILIRVSVLAGVVVLGFITIAQAQRAFRSTDESETTPQNKVELSEQSLEPIPSGEEATTPAEEPAHNPFRTTVAYQSTEAEPETAPAADYTEAESIPAELPSRGVTAVEVGDSFPTAEEALGETSPGTHVPARFAQYTEEPTPTLAPEQPRDDFEPQPAPAAPADMYNNQYEYEDAALDETPPGQAFGGPPTNQSIDPPAEFPPASADMGAMPMQPPVENAFEAAPRASFPAANEMAPPAQNTPGNFAAEPGAVQPATAQAAPMATGEGTGVPGHTDLEGQQVPSIVIHKHAPEEIQVGKPAKFVIDVQNNGSIPVEQVEVRDEIPKGTQLLSTTPAAQRTPQGELVWSLGAMQPGDETQLEIELLPLVEGEIGSVAVVFISAAASARTVATRPELVVHITGPPQVDINETAVIEIELTNQGTGAATGVFLASNLPQGLSHPAGNSLEYEIGTLEPDETRSLELSLTAVKAGLIRNVISVQGDGQAQAEGTWESEIVAPQLAVNIEGPKHRYLEKKATYNVSVGNPGTAPAKEVELVAYVPEGMKFVEADNFGEYDEQAGTVHWLLEELPAGETGTVSLTAVAIEPGSKSLRVQGNTSEGLTDESSQQVTVEGVAAILFQLVDLEDPIEVNGETGYEIRVVNQGSKAATNVRLVALVPQHLQAVSAEGPTRHIIDQPAEDQRVLFDPLPQLAPKADVTYMVKVKALQAGDARVRVQVLTDDMELPVTKEESTRVYSVE